MPAKNQTCPCCITLSVTCFIFRIIMNCHEYDNCAACVNSCRWVIRKVLDPICTLNINESVGKVEYYVDIGEVCYPPITSNASPIIINEGISRLLLMLFLGLIIGSLLIGVPMGIYIWLRRAPSTPVREISLEGITTGQNFCVRYYKRCRMDEIRRNSQLVDASEEERDNRTAQVNNP